MKIRRLFRSEKLSFEETNYFRELHTFTELSSDSNIQQKTPPSLEPGAVFHPSSDIWRDLRESNHTWAESDEGVQAASRK